MNNFFHDFFSRFDELFDPIMSVDKEEERSSKVAPVTCVFFKKSALNDKWKTKLQKEYKKPVAVAKSKSDNRVRTFDGEESSFLGLKCEGKGIETVKRCTFFKKSKLDYMERKKNKRLDFFCKHTIRYVPKTKPEEQLKPPAKPNQESVGSDIDRYNPLQRFNFPY